MTSEVRDDAGSSAKIFVARVGARHDNRRDVLRTRATEARSRIFECDRRVRNSDRSIDQGDAP